MLYSVVILKMGHRGKKKKSPIVLHCQIILCASIPERKMFEKIKVTTQIASFRKLHLKLEICMDFGALLHISFLTFKTFQLLVSHGFPVWTAVSHHQRRCGLEARAKDEPSHFQSSLFCLLDLLARHHTPHEARGCGFPAYRSVTTDSGPDIQKLQDKGLRNGCLDTECWLCSGVLCHKDQKGEDGAESKK